MDCGIQSYLTVCMDCMKDGVENFEPIGVNLFFLIYYFIEG